MAVVLPPRHALPCGVAGPVLPPLNPTGHHQGRDEGRKQPLQRSFKRWFWCLEKIFFRSAVLFKCISESQNWGTPAVYTRLTPMLKSSWALGKSVTLSWTGAQFCDNWVYFIHSNITSTFTHTDLVKLCDKIHATLDTFSSVWHFCMLFSLHSMQLSKYRKIAQLKSCSKC